MDIYALVLPLILAGVAALLIFTLVVPAAAPRFKRPHVAAWALSSLLIGSALFIDETVVQRASLGEGLAVGASACLGLAVLVPLIWLRIHMWDLILAKQRRREQEDLTARYRPKDFGD